MLIENSKNIFLNKVFDFLHHTLECNLIRWKKYLKHLSEITNCDLVAIIRFLHVYNIRSSIFSLLYLDKEDGNIILSHLQHNPKSFFMTIISRTTLPRKYFVYYYFIAWNLNWRNTRLIEPFKKIPIILIFYIYFY